jgi:hypothetical protein
MQEEYAPVYPSEPAGGLMCKRAGRGTMPEYL